MSIRCTAISLALMLATMYAGAFAQEACALRLEQELIALDDALAATQYHALRSEFLVTTVFSDPNTPTTRERVVAATGNGKSLYENDHFFLGEDQEDRVVVLPLDSSVQIYSMERPGGASSYMPYLNNLKAAMQKAKSATCRQVGGDGAGSILLTLHMPLGSDPIARLEFTYDLEHRRPRMVVGHYVKGYHIKMSRTDILRYEVGKLDHRLEKPLVSTVLRSGKLREPYSKFTLTDHRQRQTDHVEH